MPTQWLQNEAKHLLKNLCTSYAEIQRSRGKNVSSDEAARFRSAVGEIVIQQSRSVFLSFRTQSEAILNSGESGFDCRSTKSAGRHKDHQAYELQCSARTAARDSQEETIEKGSRRLVHHACASGQIL